MNRYFTRIIFVIGIIGGHQKSLAMWAPPQIPALAPWGVVPQLVSPVSPTQCVSAYILRRDGAVRVAPVFADIGSNGVIGIRRSPAGRPSPIMVDGQQCYSLPAVELTPDGPSPTQVLAFRGSISWFFPIPTVAERGVGVFDSRESGVMPSNKKDMTPVEENTFCDASPQSDEPTDDMIDDRGDGVSWLLQCALCWKPFTSDVTPCRATHRCGFSGACCATCYSELAEADACPFCAGSPNKGDQPSPSSCAMSPMSSSQDEYSPLCDVREQRLVRLAFALREPAPLFRARGDSCDKLLGSR